MHKLLHALISLMVLSLPVPLLASNSPELTAIVTDLDHAKYQTPAKQRTAAYEALALRAHRLNETAATPGTLLWEAIIQANIGAEKGALGGALGYVKEAKSLLEQAEAMNPGPAESGVYTTLGSLYYKVPGWPVGFGDKTKARAYLEKGLKLAPNDIDANYFYGDFLLEAGNYQEAADAFTKALAAPSRPGRDLADAGRRQEIQASLAKARAKLGSGR
jgi:tetratricopeptide (TPR) repeat protein